MVGKLVCVFETGFASSFLIGLKYKTIPAVPPTIATANIKRKAMNFFSPLKEGEYSDIATVSTSSFRILNLVGFDSYPVIVTLE